MESNKKPTPSGNLVKLDKLTENVLADPSVLVKVLRGRDPGEAKIFDKVKPPRSSGSTETRKTESPEPVVAMQDPETSDESEEEPSGAPQPRAIPQEVAKSAPKSILTRRSSIITRRTNQIAQTSSFSSISEVFAPTTTSTPLVVKQKPKQTPKSRGSVPMEIEPSDESFIAPAPPTRKSSVRAPVDMALTVISPKTPEKTANRSSLVINPAYIAANRKNVPLKLAQKRSHQPSLNFPVKKLRKDSKAKAPTRQPTPEVAGPSASKLTARAKPLKIIADVTDESQENTVNLQEVAKQLQQTDSPSIMRFQRSRVVLKDLDINSIPEISLKVVTKRPISQTKRIIPQLDASEILGEEMEGERDHTAEKSQSNQSADLELEAPASAAVNFDDEQAPEVPDFDEQDNQPLSQLQRAHKGPEDDSANHSSSHLDRSSSEELQVSVAPPNTPEQRRPKRAGKRKSPVKVAEPRVKHAKKTVLEQQSETEDEEDEQEPESNDNEVDDESGGEDSGVAQNDDSIIYDPTEEGCARPGLRPRRRMHPHWINDGTAKNYTITYGTTTVKEETKRAKAKALMKQKKVTETQLKLSSIIRLPADELIERINLIARERKRMPKKFVR